MPEPLRISRPSFLDSRSCHRDFFKRLALKYIAKRRGQNTVTSRDYDLTDYDALRRLVIAFLDEHQDVRR